MIFYEHGRWRSERTIDEAQSEVDEIISKLSPEELASVQHILDELNASGQSETADACAALEWDEIPIPIEDWLESDEHIGDLRKSIYPVLKKDMIELFNGGYHEVILTGSTRWGKDFFATTAMTRLLYELCCLRDPAQSMGLGAGEMIHIVPISRTTQAAKRVVFSGIKNKLALSKWFRGRYKETMDYIEFPEKRIMIVGGASSDAAALGLNVISALIDEGNFMGQVRASDTEASAASRGVDRAQMICDALVRRVKGTYKRAGVKGMIFLISSKRATDDFTERRLRDHIKNGTTSGVFVRDYATWHVRPEPFKNQKWHRCVVSSAEGRCRVLADDEPNPPDALVFEFPNDFLSEFQRDPSAAARDIAGIATDTYAPFIANREAIDAMFEDGRPHLFGVREWETDRDLEIKWNDVMVDNERGDPVPICCPTAARHVHLDLSKNLCASGICIAHQAGMTEVIREDKSTGKKVIEEVPVFHIDGVLRVLAAASGEIEHEEIRNLIYRLTEGGMNIRSVSMDHWMGVPNQQIFKKKGYRVEEISTVKKIDPYETARSALYEGRIKSPRYDLLRNELRVLELDPKRPAEKPRVIVPPGFTKDLADAFAGAIYYLAKHARGGEVLAPSTGRSDAPYGPGVTWSKGEVFWGDEDSYDGGADNDPHVQSWIL